MLDIHRHSAVAAQFLMRSSARRIRLIHRFSLLRFNSCCQRRRTFHPCCFSVRVTSLSRVLFRLSFASQKASFVSGCFACLGQLCQKQPSTKMATRCIGKTKSGLPNSGTRLRHPTMRFRRKIVISAISVALLPWPRTRDMTDDRFSLVKTSATTISIQT